MRRGKCAAWFLTAGMLCLAGCSCPMHTVRAVPEDLAETCNSVACGGRRCVHVFFLQTLHDPLDCSNLEGVKEYIQCLGFPRCWYGHAHHVCKFKEEIARVQAQEKDARIVLVGYSTRPGSVWDLARDLEAQKVTVDLLVCLDGASSHRPANVQKVLCILPEGKCDETPPAERFCFLPKSSKKATATHPATLEALIFELVAVAGSIPACEDVPQSMPHEAPTPRPLPGQDTGMRDEWDFLMPAPVDTHTALPSAAIGVAPAPRKAMVRQ